MPEGNRPEWPLLMCLMLEAELKRQQAEPRAYSGQRVLISRLTHDFQGGVPEKKAVGGLYHRCFEMGQGCLTIGNDRYWLLSYEVPNQGNYRMRKADLLALSTGGGLVVFECKLADNRYAPVAALLEGLDYLSCLTSETAFNRLQGEFWELREELGNVPAGFEEIEPTRDAQHSVILLAPQAYYDLYCRSGRGSGWQQLNSTQWQSDVLRLRFAVAEVTADGAFNHDVRWQ